MNNQLDRVEIATRGLQAILIIAGSPLIAAALLESRRRMKER